MFLASLALTLGFPPCHRVIVILPDGRRGKTKGKAVAPVRSVVTFYPKLRVSLNLYHMVIFTGQVRL